MATAVAHPNIALVKYWGKQPGPGNVPATPSLSITLDGLSTRTRVAAAPRDQLRINSRPVEDAKLQRFIAELREAFALPPIAVATCNDFPTSAGLASSASGFAALVTAIDGTFGLGLGAAARGAWARRGSASAARSIFGGFATLRSRPAEERCTSDLDQWLAAPLLDKDAWPLEVVVAVTSDTAKRVASTLGMERSRATSPFYQAWTRSTTEDFEAACRAVARRDFEALAEIAEHSCLKLHALMLSTRPALLYWNEATVAAMGAVCQMRAAGVAVFFTVDAGPQVKAVCAPGQADAVAPALAAVPGVLRVLKCRLGDGAHLEDVADPGKGG